MHRPHSGVRRASWLAALLLLSLPGGCALGPRPQAGYQRRLDPLEAVDAAPLAGRRIVLDPGHGGFFRGSIGVRGLTEAEVNLGVALELARLLRERGAEVVMTRDTDRDFLTPADSTLRADLAERVRIANAARADLFVSIHHNADARGAHDVNETQVYYPLGDEGPALEAAADVHRFLTRNLGIGSSRVVSGNFAVIRGSEAPALLTESSYITYPPTERRLAREAARRMEAEALYLGIAAYFARRAPVIESFAISEHGVELPDSALTGARPTLAARIRGAWDNASLRVDGVEVAAQRSGERIEWRPAGPLAPGLHVATLGARLAGEGSARRARVRFVVAGIPERIEAEFPDQPWWDGRQPIALRLRLLDAGGNALRDSVLGFGGGPRAPFDLDTTVATTDGVAWLCLEPLPTKLPDTLETLDIRADLARFADARWGGRRVFSQLAAVASLPIRRGVLPPVRTAFARRMPGGERLLGAPGTREPEPRITWINRDGLVRLPADSSGAVAVPELPGYRAWAGDPPWPPRFVAIADGALHGRRVVLDPAGGGDDPGGVSASGTRGAALNLEVARMLASMLASAGAEVRLTRTSDAALSDLERVRISEEFRADRYLRIGHPAAPPRLGHYFSSAAGKRWAARLADVAAELGLPRPTSGDDAQYPIQQTSATALFAALGRVDDPAAVLGVPDPSTLRTEAYALYLSLAREWAADAPWATDSLEVRTTDGRPRPRVAVRLGGALVLQTDPLGRIRFARTEAGPMLVEVEDSGAPMRRVLLDSDRGVVLTGP